MSGATLDPQSVRRAREEEIKYVRDMDLYEKVPIIECYAKTGKAPISVRWVDISKGDEESPKFRYLLVVRVINIHKRVGLFAATPPLEAFLRTLSMPSTGNR